MNFHLEENFWRKLRECGPATSRRGPVQKYLGCPALQPEERAGENRESERGRVREKEGRERHWEKERQKAEDRVRSGRRDEWCKAEGERESQRKTETTLKERDKKIVESQREREKGRERTGGSEGFGVSSGGTRLYYTKELRTDQAARLR